MPCQCDSMTDAEMSDQHLNDVERLHKELCRARAIIRLLLKSSLTIPGDLKAKANHEVKLLLTHKKLEIKHDIEGLQIDLAKVTNKIKQITGLGGIPGQPLLNDKVEIESAIKDLSGLSDEEILGT